MQSSLFLFRVVSKTSVLVVTTAASASSPRGCAAQCAPINVFVVTLREISHSLAEWSTPSSPIKGVVPGRVLAFAMTSIQDRVNNVEKAEQHSVPTQLQAGVS